MEYRAATERDIDAIAASAWQMSLARSPEPAEKSVRAGQRVFDL
ncbi:hypothetical protein ACFPIJ_28810 [Dactylosporangium cerinum]|uniref:GNAT family N-acetyltransferase n=1 Tax=Dactylosporangium cerinum TaxID=1434730 RepID=A0ABV9VZM0_9ACTN